MKPKAETNTPKRPRGRPRKNPLPETKAPETKVPQEKQGFSAGSRWSDSSKQATFLAKVRGADPDKWRDRSSDDLLGLPPEAHAWLADHKLSAQWCTKSVRGAEMERHFANFLKNGWTPVEDDTIPGVTKREIEGLVLCVRPIEITAKAKAAAMAAARQPILERQSLLTEGVPVPGGNHPSALRTNKINKTLERIEIPSE
jgi:hypothetical protein